MKFLTSIGLSDLHECVLSWSLSNSPPAYSQYQDLLQVLLSSRFYKSLILIQHSSIKSLGPTASTLLWSQPREVRHTQVSLVIVAVFIMCHSVRWIPNVWEMKQAGTDTVGE